MRIDARAAATRRHRGGRASKMRISRSWRSARPDARVETARECVEERGVGSMKYGRRDIFEDIAATLLMTVTVLGYTSTHESWNVWLIGDSRRWTAGLLTV